MLSWIPPQLVIYSHKPFTTCQACLILTAQTAISTVPFTKFATDDKISLFVIHFSALSKALVPIYITIVINKLNFYFIFFNSVFFIAIKYISKSINLLIYCIPFLSYTTKQQILHSGCKYIHIHEEQASVNLIYKSPFLWTNQIFTTKIPIHEVQIIFQNFALF